MQTRSFLRLSTCLLTSILAATGCSDPATAPTDGGPDLLDGETPREDAFVPRTDAGPRDGGPPDGGGRFDSGPPEPCPAPGAIETAPCGSCGTVERFCTAERTWAYGICVGEGACAPGSLGSMACGSCGTQATRCNATCTWEPTGACSGEGECAPGTRTRTGSGCAPGETREALCSAACVYEGVTECASDGCPTPGALETVACGMCGTRDRFCNASRVWEYGACTGEGVCAPGTTGSSACGMCGTQTTRCTDACTWSTFGSCTGEGTCAPGTTQRTSAGCPAGQTRVLRCDPSCGYTIEVEACGATHPVDVMFLLDQTGSNNPQVTLDLPSLQSRCITPLLALRDVQVGVSYSGEFPVTPYGSTGDRPFEGGIEPTASSAALSTEIAGRPTFSGADGSDATVEAISMLTGGGVASSSIPLVCSAGRTAGGCWRSGARQVIVIHTDSPIHNGPTAGSSTIYDPYSGISPTPAAWPAVRTRMTTSGTLLVWLDSDASSPGPAQFDQMLTDLGQPLTDHHRTPTSTGIATACDAIVARVRVLAGL